MSSYQDLRDVLEELLKNTSIKQYVSQWIDYQANNQNRLKMLHDLRLADGTELSRYYPNANSWCQIFGGEGPGRVTDDQVTHIRLSSDQSWSFK